MSNDAIDRELLLTMFLAEAEESLASIEQALVALESCPGDADVINTIFRGAHTLKGNAATFDFQPIVDVAHLAEDLLDELRAGRMAVTSGLITLLLQCVDTFRALVAAATTDPHALPPVDLALLDALRKAIAIGDHVESPAEERGASSPHKPSDTLRVSLEKLDTMMNLAGEIAVVRGRMRDLIDQLGEPSSPLAETQELLDRLSATLQDQITGVRMVPLGPLFQQQIRIARDLARAAGKIVQIRFEGQGVELDLAVVDRLRDPLLHMLRNAIDHGIEDPDRRVAAGKQRSGTIALRAFRDGSMVVIEVSDDGAGLDAQRIADTARRTGLIAPSHQPSKEQIASLVFVPGLSTAATVTELSGRGVGMDVVQRNIAALRGTVSIDSADGEGTTVTIRLPLTLAIIDALSVGVGEQTFILPLDPVVECFDIADGDLMEGATGTLAVRGQAIPFLRLAASLGVAATSLPRRNLILVRDGERQVGIVVDRLNSRTQAVIKPLRKPLPCLQAIAGATILGDGSVALILDLPRLLRQQLREAV